MVSLESPFCFFLFFFCLSLSKLSFLCLLYRSVLSSIFWGWISSLASNKICLLFGYHEDAQNFPGMQGCVSLCGEDGPVQMERLCPGVAGLRAKRIAVSSARSPMLTCWCLQLVLHRCLCVSPKAWSLWLAEAVFSYMSSRHTLIHVCRSEQPCLLEKLLSNSRRLFLHN